MQDKDQSDQSGGQTPFNLYNKCVYPETQLRSLQTNRDFLKILGTFIVTNFEKLNAPNEIVASSVFNNIAGR